MKTKLTALIVIIIVAAAICGYLLSSQKAPTQSTPPLVTTPTSTIPTMPSETYGMSQYVNATYGFSFWYPGALKVTTTATHDGASFPGGTAVETVQVGPAGGITIYVVNSASSMITDEPANHASPIAQTQYFYNGVSGQWMVDYPGQRLA